MGELNGLGRARMGEKKPAKTKKVFLGLAHLEAHEPMNYSIDINETGTVVGKRPFLRQFKTRS